MNDFVLYSLIALLAFNIYVNIKLLTSSLFNKFQKIAQSIIIWVLPLLGAMLILYLVKDTDKGPPPPSKPFGGGDNGIPGY